MAYYFRVQHHGGACCGIKHIWFFPQNPQSLLGKEEPLENFEVFQGEANSYYCGDKQFLQGGFPAQPAKERLKSVLDLIIQKRPSGIVEVCLNNYQKLVWEEIVLNLGFKLVSQAFNSNSGNNIYVYHFIYKGED